MAHIFDIDHPKLAPLGAIPPSISFLGWNSPILGSCRKNKYFVAFGGRNCIYLEFG